MKKKDLYLCFLLFFIGIVSRLPILEKIQSHWDGPQYSIALIKYSLEQQTPGPPGYPLYIALGKFLYIFFKDPHFAILLVSVLAAALGSVILYLVGKNMYGRAVGITSSVIFLTGSPFYYFGLTPYAYLIIPVMTTLLAYVTYLIFIKKRKIGILFGIFFGIRPQEILQTFGLVLLAYFYLPKKEKVKSISVFSLVTLLWLIPLLYSTGVFNYFKLSLEFFKVSITHQSLFQRIELMVKGFLLSFGLSSFAMLYYLWKLYKGKLKKIIKNGKFIILYSAWILPSFAYNFILRTEHAGYQMSYLAGFLMLISYVIWKITAKSKIKFSLVILSVAIFNLYWFFYDRDPRYVKPYRPTSFHYSDIRKNDLKTGSKINFIISQLSPEKTLVITNSVLWRPYTYHLKDYQVTSLDGLVDNHPKFFYSERDSKNWHMKTFENRNLSLDIPNNISYVVLPDDENYQWITDYPYRVFELPGNSRVAVLTVNPGDKLIYKFHFLSIVRNN
jgi:4-amino-4-deoxy-L-arabinose transferase-like glycosyltransferase